MNTNLTTIVVGIIALVSAVLVAKITGRAAKKTADTNAAADAWEQVLPYWKATIEQLQGRSQDQAAQIGKQDVRIKEQDAQISELQSEQRLNIAWKQAALAHILALHTYVRMHLHRNDIPAVPPELAADIPSFTQPQPPAV